MSGDDAKSTGWPPVRGPCYLRTMPSILPADVAAVHDGWRRRGHFVTLAEGQRLFVAQEGEGPDLLLVHGFPSTSHDFAAALPHSMRSASRSGSASCGAIPPAPPRWTSAPSPTGSRTAAGLA